MSEETTQEITDTTTETEATTEDTGIETPLFTSEEAPEPERPEWLPEKFKDPAALAKSYTELEKKFMEKHNVPESYDKEKIKELTGLEIADNELWDSFQNDMKAKGFSQEQANYVMQFGADWMRDVIAKITPQVDLSTERQALESEWGAEAGRKYKAVESWAVSTLGKDVLVKPLINTAAGVKFLEQLMRGQKGPSAPVQSDVAADKVDRLNQIAEQLAALMGRPDYWTNEAIQKQAQSLDAEAVRLKR